MSRPLKAFITYSHEDDQKRKKLRTRLAVMERNGEIEPRDDTDIAPGGKARQEDILKAVANSDMLLYLVSAASLASKNCNKELTEAVRVGSQVIPIILESCDWLNDRLSDFQALPDKGEPINKWQPESDGWQNVVDGIREAIEEIQVQADTPRTSEKELRAKSAFQHGNVLMMLGQVDMAIEHYSHAIELNPNNATTYSNRGVAYTDKDDFAPAISDYTRAIELKPDYAEAYFNRGNAYHRNGDDDRAISDHTRAIELKPDYAAAYTNRGLAHQNKGDFDLAFKDHAKAIGLEPNFAEAYFNRGGAYKSKNNYDYALADFTKVIDLNPDFAGAYNHRGIVYLDRDDYDYALADFTKAIDLNPDFLAEAYYNRGLAYHKKGEYDFALVDYTKAIDLNPDFVAEVYYNRGRIWLYRREWKRGKSDLTAAKDGQMDIITAFLNDYGSVAGFKRITGIQLPVDLAAMLTSQGAAMGEDTEQETTHESATDFESVLDEIVSKYDRAWKTLAKP